MADDPELQAIRAARLAQLQKQRRPAGGDSSGGGGGEQEAEQRQKQEQARRDMLATVLDSSARERLSRIALVNTSLSNQMESILLRMAQSGQIRQRVTEEQLINLLEQAEAAEAKSGPKKTISYQRRKDVDDDDDFDL